MCKAFFQLFVFQKNSFRESWKWTGSFGTSGVGSQTLGSLPTQHTFQDSVRLNGARIAAILMA